MKHAGLFLFCLLLLPLRLGAQFFPRYDFTFSDEEALSVQPYSGDSLTDTNYVSYLLQSCILEKLAEKDLQSRTWHIQDSLLALQQTATDSRIPISISAYNYTTEEPFPGPGGHGFLLVVPHPLVLSCPVKLISKKRTVTFTFSQTEYSNLSYSSIQFDPGDGLGFRGVSLGDSLFVNYSTDGIKELKTKLQTGNSYKYSHSQICVIETSTPNIVPFSFSYQENIDTTVCGVHVSATIQTKILPGHQHIVKPFIVAEEFDPVDASSYAIKDSLGFSSGKSFENIWNQLSGIKGQYDLVYINWNNPEADIRYNAALLQKIIRRINNEKHSAGSQEKGVLMGRSMGGLIARCALRGMEDASLPHEIGTFICHDVPNQGANIPVSLQRAWFLIKDFLDTISIGDIVLGDFNIGEWRTILDKYINGISARQMSYYYAGTENPSTTSFHDTFYNTVLPPLPEGDEDYGIVNIALSNAGLFNYSSYLTQSGQFMSASLSKPALPLYSDLMLTTQEQKFAVMMLALFLNYFNPFCNLTFCANINTGNNTVASSLNSGINWLILDVPQYQYNRSFNFNGETCYDTSSYGSYFEVPDIVHTFLNSNLPPGTNLDFANRFLFIPKESSLAGTDSTTPFNAYYYPATAQYHTSIDDFSAAWLDRQITGLSISGPDNPVFGDQYTATGFPSTVTWSTSNSSIASINPTTGEINPLGTGVVDVIATCIVNGREKYYKSKRVTVTYSPAVVIRIGAEYNQGIPYLYAELFSPDSTYNAFLHDDESNLSYHWVFKVDWQEMEHRYSSRAYLHGWENCGSELFFLSVTMTDHDHGNSTIFRSRTFPAYSGLFVISHTAIIVTPNGVYRRSNSGQLTPYGSDSPLVIGCTPGLSDGIITNQMTLVLENEDEFVAYRDNDTWSYYIFEDDELLDEALDAMGVLEDGDSYCLLMQMKNTYDVPHKELFIPIIYTNNL